MGFNSFTPSSRSSSLILIGCLMGAAISGYLTPLFGIFGSEALIFLCCSSIDTAAIEVLTGLKLTAVERLLGEFRSALSPESDLSILRNVFFLSSSSNFIFGLTISDTLF